MAIIQEPRAAAAEMVPAVFFAQAQRLADRVALRRKEFGIWRRITWADYARNVRWVAHALLHLGLQPGERVVVAAFGKNQERPAGGFGAQSGPGRRGPGF